MFRRKLCLLALLLVVASGLSQPGETTTIELTGRTMGPVKYKILVARPAASTVPENVQTAVQTTLDRVNDLMSTYQPESDIGRFNASDSLDWQPVDLETAQVIQRAIEISELTAGAFDITVAPAVNLWRFGPDKSQLKTLPTDDRIAELQSQIGFQKLAVRLDPPTIKKSQPDLQIDLSAIAKGYAVDQVAVTLNKMGFQHFMIEVGGEVFVQGARARGGKWRIATEIPRYDRWPAEWNKDRVLLTDQAIATSGDYQNFNTIAGKRYSHTIDPKTCRPVDHTLAAASVIADDCMTADAIATAMMVMGNEQGAAFCRENGFEFFTISRSNNANKPFVQLSSDQFPAFSAAEIKAQSNASSQGNAPSNEVSLWPTFLGALVVFLIAILGMAVGVLFGNRPVQGSCGGLSSMPNEDGESSCSLCSKPTVDCKQTSS